MSSYVDDVLIKDETVQYRAKLSLWSFFWLIFLGLLLLPAFGLGLLLWIAAWVIYISTELAITNKRIIAKSGLIERKTMEMFLEKVESIQVDQSVLGRIFNFGSITISGTGGDKSPIKSISDPIQFRKAFMSAVDSNRPQAAAPNPPARV